MQISFPARARHKMWHQAKRRRRDVQHSETRSAWSSSAHSNRSSARQIELEIELAIWRALHLASNLSPCAEIALFYLAKAQQHATLSSVARPPLTSERAHPPTRKDTRLTCPVVEGILVPWKLFKQGVGSPQVVVEQLDRCCYKTVVRWQGR